MYREHILPYPSSKWYINGQIFILIDPTSLIHIAWLFGFWFWCCFILFSVCFVYCFLAKGVFTWRWASPLGRASPTKRAGFYMGKASPPTRAGSLSRVTRANYIYFSTKPGIPIFADKFSFYILHISKQSLWNKKLSKKCWSRQPLSCVGSFDLLALLGRPALLSAFIWEIPSPPRRDLGSQ